MRGFVVSCFCHNALDAPKSIRLMQSRAQHLRVLISFSNPKWEFLQYTLAVHVILFFPQPLQLTVHQSKLLRYLARSSDTDVYNFLLTAYRPWILTLGDFLFCNYCSRGTRSSWTSLRFSTQYFIRRDAFHESFVIELSTLLPMLCVCLCLFSCNLALYIPGRFEMVFWSRLYCLTHVWYRV